MIGLIIGAAAGGLLGNEIARAAAEARSRSLSFLTGFMTNAYATSSSSSDKGACATVAKKLCSADCRDSSIQAQVAALELTPFIRASIYPAIMSAAMISTVPARWIWRLVTVPRACPSSADTVFSVKPRRFAVEAKLYRRTCGVMSESGVSAKTAFHYLGNPFAAFSSERPGNTNVVGVFGRNSSSYG